MPHERIPGGTFFFSKGRKNVFAKRNDDDDDDNLHKQTSALFISRCFQTDNAPTEPSHDCVCRRVRSACRAALVAEQSFGNSGAPFNSETRIISVEYLAAFQAFSIVLFHFKIPNSQWEMGQKDFNWFTTEKIEGPTSCHLPEGKGNSFSGGHSGPGANIRMAT